MSKQDALEKARKLKNLLQKKWPVERMWLFGSQAKGKATETSDIDIAVLTLPFASTKHRENTEFMWACKDIDLRIETICLHPEDLDNKYHVVAQEALEHGIEV